MDNASLFNLQFNNIPNVNNHPNAPRILKHYLQAITKGMKPREALDRAIRDLAGDNYHPTKPQRSGFNNKPETHS